MEAFTDVFTYKLQKTDVFPQSPHTASEAQGEGDAAHHQDQPDRVKAMQPGYLGQVQQDSLRTTA